LLLQYKCPFEYLDKQCGHELHGPEGYEDDGGGEAFRVWCPCGFRGPAFYIDPIELRFKKKKKDKR
jgi:hypothetical protein